MLLVGLRRSFVTVRPWYNCSTVAAYTQDDGFHEIQLNGKQLVFLFMAATVVSVVIFLCGVLVGRGVRAERGDLVQNAAIDAPTVEVAPAASEGAPPGSGPAAAEPASAQPPTPVDELSYFNRLEKPTPAVETLRPAPEKDAPARPAPVPAATPPQSVATAPVVPAVATSDTPAVAGSQNWTVQVAALNVRREADAMATRLSSKGYAAYVVAPASNTAVFRVRIGSFKTRREAEAMAAKLKKEEQFNPWVVR